MSGSILVDPRFAEADARTLEAPVSAISWPAIIAGTVAAASVSLVLVALGSGFGLALASPMSSQGPSAGTLTIVTIAWLIVAQWIAAGLGGYLTGRLRTKWVGTHTHEVFFRDTAHGFLTWSAATLVGVLVLASASSALVGGGVRAAATVGAGLAQGATMGAATMAPNALGGLRGYELDNLFRSSQPDTGNAGSGDPRAEAGRILAQGVAKGDVPAADKTYLAQLVAAKSGIPQADAQKRVDDLIAQEKAAAAKAAEALDTARKAAAKFSIFTALSMLIGAFIACTAAALGGQQRDEYP